MPLRDAITAYLASQPVFSSAGLTPWYWQEHRLGWLEAPTLAFLTSWSPHFQLQAGQLRLDCSESEVQALLDEAALALRAAGLIKVWRNERYSVHPLLADDAPDLGTALFTLERGAFRRLGLCSQAAHINGRTVNGDYWLGRRASTKGIDPNRLDNLAAGGIPHDESPGECVIRELGEEAGIAPALAAQAIPTATLRTLRNESDGTHHEVLYCYDLVVPEGVTPNNQDGEVAGFQRFSAADTIARLPEMTWDAGLVTAHSLLAAQENEAC
ncbi:DUF4743 domain-containing protein [Chitinibacter tainanensis]|uniref:NUDIX hydrolase n=1 Tax=Chitinibacter tainanensis TaxID=230667 RepID=UPI002355740F|nr:DUF4743 domain-containing protein [Chitinibacter tainanensis]